MQDGVGRLWGYDADQHRPCAYKAADGTSVFYEGYKQVRLLLQLGVDKGNSCTQWVCSTPRCMPHTDLNRAQLTCWDTCCCSGGVGDGTSMYWQPNYLQLHAGH